MSSSKSKILETEINVFKSNSLIMKNKNIMEYQLYTNASKIDSSMIPSDKNAYFCRKPIPPSFFANTPFKSEDHS